MIFFSYTLGFEQLIKYVWSIIAFLTLVEKRFMVTLLIFYGASW
jgi:hypothetical protein